MTIPLCRLCPAPAHFNFREGILLCAECAADVLELCRISSELAISEAAAPPASRDRQSGGHLSDARNEMASISSITEHQHKQSPQPLQVTEHDGIPQMFRRAG